MRVAHYDKTGYKIKLYADIPTLQLESGIIDYKEYSKLTRIPFSTRILTKILKKTKYDLVILDANNKQEVRSILKGKKCAISCCSENKANSVAEIVLKKQHRGYSENLCRVFYLDDKNPKYSEDWNKLIQEHPEVKGRFVVLIPTMNIEEDIDIHTKSSGKTSSMYKKKAAEAA